MIFVTGGTGFIGKEVVRQLQQEKKAVRLLVHTDSLNPVNDGIEEVTGDILDLESLVKGMKGCDTVIHLVGIIREAGKFTFEKAHVEGTQNVLIAAQRNKIKKIVHMSALGASEYGSRYQATKWKAETLVRQSGIPYVIFKPSIVFGEKDSFINFLAKMIKLSPGVIPVIGTGTNKFQPIWVKDVARCLVKAALSERIADREYVLTGLEVVTYDELLDIILKQINRKRLKIHLPVRWVKPVVKLLEKFPNPVLTSDQLIMLQEDNVADNTPMKRDFVIEPQPMSKILPTYLK